MPIELPMVATALEHLCSICPISKQFAYLLDYPFAYSYCRHCVSLSFVCSWWFNFGIVMQSLYLLLFYLSIYTFVIFILPIYWQKQSCKIKGSQKLPGIGSNTPILNLWEFVPHLESQDGKIISLSRQVQALPTQSIMRFLSRESCVKCDFYAMTYLTYHMYVPIQWSSLWFQGC